MKTDELTGKRLNWAVAKAIGEYSPTAVPEYSTDWAHGGPIIEREKIDVMWCGDRWCAYTADAECTTGDDRQLVTEGATPLIAAMRGYVASKLGDEVELPEDIK